MADTLAEEGRNDLQRNVTRIALFKRCVCFAHEHKATGQTR